MHFNFMVMGNSKNLRAFNFAIPLKFDAREIYVLQYAFRQSSVNQVIQHHKQGINVLYDMPVSSQFCWYQIVLLGDTGTYV